MLKLLLTATSDVCLLKHTSDSYLQMIVMIFKNYSLKIFDFQNDEFQSEYQNMPTLSRSVSSNNKLQYKCCKQPKDI